MSAGGRSSSNAASRRAADFKMPAEARDGDDCGWDRASM